MHTILNILRTGDQYHFTWTKFAGSRANSGTPAHSSSASVSLHGTVLADPDKLQALQKRIAASVQTLNLTTESPAATTSQNSTTGSTVFESLGRMLFGQFIPTQIQQAIRALPNSSTIQLITNDTALPWELLHDGSNFLVLQHHLARSPLLDSAPPHAEPETNAPGVADELFCLLLGNPTSDLPAAEEEILEIQDILYTARPRVNIDLLAGDQVSSTQFTERLASKKYGLIHYAGHATQGKLHLSDGWASAQEVSKVIGNHPIILLHACSSAATPTQPITTLSDLSAGAESLASAFMAAGASAVIGMLWPVPDEDMLHLSQELYTHFVKGRSIAEALCLSRSAMQKRNPQGTSWLSPVLYGNPDQIVIPSAPRQASGALLEARFPAKPTLPAIYQNGHNPSTDESVLTFHDLVARSGGTIIHASNVRLTATFGIEQPRDDCSDQALEAAKEMLTLAASRWQKELPSIVIASGEIKILTQHGDAPHGSASSVFIGDPLIEVQQLLKYTAPGEVLLNKLAYDRCRESLHTQTRAIHELEEETQFGYRVLWDTAEPLPELAVLESDIVIGREDERQRLQTYWTNAVMGSGQAMGIIGEAGIGKSHLVREFEQTVLKTDATVLRLVCTTSVQNTPYALLARLFRALLNLPDAAEPQEIEHEVRLNFVSYVEKKGESAEADLQLLIDLLGGTQSTKQRPEQSVYQHRLYNLLRVQLAHLFNSNPLLLIVEDLHWADKASLDVLNFLVDEIQQVPILFLHAYRSTEQWSPPWRNSAAFQPVQLADFSLTQRQELFKQTFNITELPDALVEFIAQASGNPLFLSEILIALRESWQPTETDTIASKTALQNVLRTLEIPDTIQRTIQMRFGQLPEEDARVLEMAAVIDQGCTKEMLQVGLTMSNEALDGYLRSLVGRNFLHHSWGDERYEFRHGLVQEVVYGQIDAARRQQWHKKIGERLAEQRSAEDDTSLALLTHHYFSSLVEEHSRDLPLLNPESDADLIETALGYLVRSGKAAMDRYGGYEAAILFERARVVTEQLATEHRLKVDIYAGLGDAYTFNGEHGQAITSYQNAHGLCHHQPLTIENRPLTADLARKLGRLQMIQGQHALADSWFETGMTYVEHHPAYPCRSAAALLQIHRGSNCFDHGDNESARQYCQRGLSIAQQCSNLKVEAEGHFLLGAILQSQGQYTAALEAYGKSLTIQRELKDEYQIHRIEGNVGLIYLYTGQWSQAAVYFEKVHSYWKELNEQDLFALVCMNGGLLSQYQGNWSQASQQYEQALEIWRKVENQYFLVLCHSNLANLSIEKEEWENAGKHLDDCELRINEYDLHDLQAYVLCCRVRVALGHKQLDSACDYAEKAKQRLDTEDKVLDIATIFQILGEVASALGKAESAYEYYEQSIRLLDQLKMPYEKGRIKYYMAQVEGPIATKCRKIDDCEEAISIFEELGAKADLAKAQKLRKQIEDDMK